MIELAQIDEAIKGVNAASNGGAQWILCALALAAMGFVWVIIQHFMRREKEKEERFMAHQERELEVSEKRTIAVLEHNRLLLKACEGIEELNEQRISKYVSPN
jgi:hypothetical protein